MLLLSFLILSLNLKVLFCVCRDSCNNDVIAAVALLFISIMITLFLAAISAKLSNHKFRLSFTTTVFLSFKVILVIYYIVSYFVGIHHDIMLFIQDLSFTYIIPVFLGNEFLTLSMSQPITGWVHYTGNNGGGANGGGGPGNGGPGQRPDPITLANAPNPFYSYNNATGIFRINDPNGLINSTNGRFNPNHNYNRSPFFRNAERFLAMNRDEFVTLIPRNLDPVQLRFLQDMRQHHYLTIEHPNSNRPYSPLTGGSSENTSGFREFLSSKGS
jgi:hypothetical protein